MVAVEAERAGQSLADFLGERALVASGGDASAAIRLAHGLHVVPEFLGNRAPHADPHSRAVIAGLGMEFDEASLVALYVAGIAGLGYGLRQILAAQAAAGASVSAIAISGGAGRSRLVRQILADATGLPVAAPMTDEPVLLGSAMLGAVAAGSVTDLEAAMETMSSIGEILTPALPEIRAVHDARYTMFEQFQALARQAAANRFA